MATIAAAVLREATQKVPATKYAVGVVGIAAALSIVLSLTGKLGNPIVPLSLVFIGMILLFVFSAAVYTGIMGATVVATVLVWSIILFFLTFLSFTVSAFAFGLPCNWAEFISVEKSPSCASPPAPNTSGDAPPMFPSNPVTSFFYQATDPGNPGARYWTRTSDSWIEKTPSGEQHLFRILKRISYSNCDGEIVSRVGDNNFQILIPDKGCPNMTMKFRRLPDVNWVSLPDMQAII